MFARQRFSFSVLGHFKSILLHNVPVVLCSCSQATVTCVALSAESVVQFWVQPRLCKYCPEGISNISAQNYLCGIPSDGLDTQKEPKSFLRTYSSAFRCILLLVRNQACSGQAPKVQNYPCLLSSLSSAASGRAGTEFRIQGVACQVQAQSE